MQKNQESTSEKEAHKIDFGYKLVDEDRKADQVREVFDSVAPKYDLSLIHISEPTRLMATSRMPSSA